jgi:hypothetical protein
LWRAHRRSGVGVLAKPCALRCCART